MFEVEAKVPISKKEFELLKKRLQKEAKYLGTEIRKDTYYAKPKTAYIRIRERGGDHTFNLKRRQTIRGIESNFEMEWRLKDAGKWRSLLRKLKLSPGIRKSKRSTSFAKNNFIIELNHVRLLGYYLEIERVVKSQKEAVKAKSDLIKMFNSLGYSRRQFEPRPYLELLQNV
ncbi:MAG: class IV adenylate cyclase [Patescibacteria group bacterium]